MHDETKPAANIFYRWLQILTISSNIDYDFVVVFDTCCEKYS